METDAFPGDDAVVEAAKARWKDRMDEFGKKLSGMNVTMDTLKTEWINARCNLATLGELSLEEQLRREGVPDFSVSCNDRCQTWCVEDELTSKCLDPPEDARCLPFLTTGRQGLKIVTMDMQIDYEFASQINAFRKNIADRTAALQQEDTEAKRAMIAEVERALTGLLRCKAAIRKEVVQVVVNYLNRGSNRVPPLATWLTGVPCPRDKKRTYEAAEIRSAEALRSDLPALFKKIKAIDGSHLFQRSGTWKDYSGKPEWDKNAQREQLGFVGAYVGWAEKIIEGMPPTEPPPADHLPPFPIE